MQHARHAQLAQLAADREVVSWRLALTFVFPQKTRVLTIPLSPFVAPSAADCPTVPGYDFFPLQMPQKAMTVSELPGYIESGATFELLDAGKLTTDTNRLAAQTAVVNALRNACDATATSISDDASALTCNAFNTFGEVRISTTCVPGARGLAILLLYVK